MRSFLLGARRYLSGWMVSSALMLSFGALSCGGAVSTAPAAQDALAALSLAAKDSTDGDAVGRLLLGELLLPGGDAKRAADVRRRLNALETNSEGQNSLFAAFAKATDDDAHGRFRLAAAAYIQAISAARESKHPDAKMVAWVSAFRLIGLRNSVSGLWEQAKNTVERAIRQPGSIGWRARGELIGLYLSEGHRKENASKKPGDPIQNPLELAAELNGCLKHARMAGPFGVRIQADKRTAFEAERPGPWPYTFPKLPRQKEAPRVLGTERNGCALRTTESTQSGVFYVESFFDLEAETDLLVAVQGAHSVFVDDTLVLSRDSRVWGIWARFGTALRLSAGRHRIVAKVVSRETSIRVLRLDGTPVGVEGSDDPSIPYVLTPPQRLPDPNELDPFFRALGVPGQPGEAPSPPRELNDPIALYLASYLAHAEDLDDVAQVLLEPLVKDLSKATGPALAAQAVYVEDDPIFPEGDARDVMKDLRAKAAAKDASLWWPRFWLILDEGDKAGAPFVMPKLRALADEFSEVPDIWKALSTVYGRIGYKAEQSLAIKEAARRFPDDLEAISALRRLYEEQGELEAADKIASHMKTLDPDLEIDFERAIERRDFKKAAEQLQEIAKRRANRKDIALRMADLLVRAGAPGKTGDISMEKLEEAVRKDPEDSAAHLALADARFAAGDKKALHRGLIDSILSGADDGSLREAIELLEGTTELSAYRRDGKKMIQEFEASGKTMPGTAARVLDYAAIWVHPDGSARMLEHGIIGIQSREAIAEHAEQRVPRGLVLKLRTVKKDGRTFEPEFVQGKPTVTMPHLEVGDYIETESLVSLRGDGESGYRFFGPRWFFREEKLSYWLSEFIVISPKTKPMQIETGGSVPEPMVSESGAMVVRRFRVDKSPALPEEPQSAPLSEFLPNVRVGWGVSLEDSIQRLIDGFSDETPRDPRLIRIAKAIAGEQGEDTLGVLAPPKADVPSSNKATERPQEEQTLKTAQRVYRWVMNNIEPDRESDPRKAIIGKRGNRLAAFIYLCRLLGLDVSLGAVRDRLMAPPTGPFSEAEFFDSIAVRIAGPKQPMWMVVRDKFAPFGFLPSSLRGQPAVVLKPGAPRETTPAVGVPDGVTHEGTGVLAPDGSIRLSIEQRYDGKFAILLRNVMETLPQARLFDTIESKLLPQSLPGARLMDLDVKNVEDLDAPLVMSMKVKMQNFGLPRDGGMVISPPFQVRLGGLVALPVRETPLYISESASVKVKVNLKVTLPEGAKVLSPLTPARIALDNRFVEVTDRVKGQELWLQREIDIPAGRVQPEAYADFVEFVRSAESALLREIEISL